MYADDDDPPPLEWDPAKAAENVARHDVSFDEAATAFDDRSALVMDDPGHSLDESRFLLLGVSVRARLLVVSHCFRHEEATIRIISARKATSGELSYYFGRSF